MQCTGALDNGRIFDGTEDQPLVFTMGERGGFPGPGAGRVGYGADRNHVFVFFVRRRFEMVKKDNFCVIVARIQ